ncbi:MAG: UDP-N-acetylmuramate--L-alanine ligase, partial [Bdellovibrionales bacterium]
MHFIGIGGIGMCGLAELMHNMGVQVKGSDISENQQTLRLREIGIKIEIGHRAENISDIDVAVYSSAVKNNNIEYAEAKRQHIPLIPRAEALAEIMRLKRGVAVAGTHGKTTTTSMVATLFLNAHLDPTIVVGGRLDLIKSTAKLGSGEWLIAEADESDGSFNRLSPEIAIITNIDNDHLDHFGNIQNLENAFYEFASRLPFYGVAIVCGDDERIKNVFKEFPKRILTYGFEKSNHFRIEGSKSHYKIFKEQELLGDFHLQIPGKHNALNALAAIITGHLAGVPYDRCLKGIEAYAGVDRRFQKKGTAFGVDYYDDYGHHPTEIKAVLAAFKEQFPDRRVVTLFQP